MSSLSRGSPLAQGRWDGEITGPIVHTQSRGSAAFQQCLLRKSPQGLVTPVQFSSWMVDYPKQSRSDFISLLTRAAWHKKLRTMVGRSQGLFPPLPNQQTCHR